MDCISRWDGWVWFGVVRAFVLALSALNTVDGGLYCFSDASSWTGRGGISIISSAFHTKRL